jgi:muconolactone delta-isomerase
LLPTALRAATLGAAVSLTSALLAAPLAPVTPAPTGITARLLTPLSSYGSKPGDRIEATVVSPVCLAGTPLPVGATLRGEVKRVHRVGFGIEHETAAIELAVGQLGLPDGTSYQVEARLTAIENARERVDRHGVIHGIRATDSLSSRFSSRLLFAVPAHPAILIPALIVETWMFRFPEPEIEYRAGTELHLDVHFPAAMGAASACPRKDPAPEVQAELENLLAGVPTWSYSKRQPQPIDMVNLLFVGSRAEVETAFRAAGWTGSQPTSLWTGFQAVRAIAENRGYPDAPMRTLLLDGLEPDLRVQESLDTFGQRDHLRVWRREGEWQGQAIWAAAATHDIAATFSRRPFGFTHAIQTNLDIERDKVVRDLEYTGCVDNVVFSRRPESAPQTSRDYRKGLETDARVAIILLNSCTDPRRLSIAAGLDGTPPLEMRLVRRVTLTARNHLIRDNLVWRTGDAARLTWRAFRTWENDRKNEQRIARQGEVLSANREDPVRAGGR